MKHSSLVNKILLERPWDWYLKDSYMFLGWRVGELLIQLGDQKKSQEYLQHAWHTSFKMFGRDDLIGKYPILPVKGAEPVSASAEDKVFFERFVKGSKKNSGKKKFTIPIDFGRKEEPVYFYIMRGKQGYKELQDQFVWFKEYRGGQVSKDVANSFHKLNKIAIENNVDFLELCVYALAKEKKPNKQACANLGRLRFVVSKTCIDLNSRP